MSNGTGLGVPFGSLIYAPNFDFWAVQVNFNLAVGGAIAGRGIFDTRALNVMAEDSSI